MSDKVQNKLVVLLLILSFNAYGQTLSEVNFDLARVPFSRYGSYMSLSTMDRVERGKHDLYLYELKGANIWKSNTLLRIKPTSGDSTIEIEYTATPLEIRGKTQKGSLTIFFESADIVHIRANGMGLSLIGDFGLEDTYQVPGFPSTWKLRDKMVIVSTLNGKVKMDKSGTGSSFLFNPDNGEVHLVIEQFHSDWLPKKYSDTYKKSREELKKELDTWQQKTVSVPAAYHSAMLLASYINWSCIMKPQGNVTRYAIAMSKNWMYNIWSWDNCFNAMGLSYQHPKAAWDQLMVLFDHQDTTGAMPDYINSHHVVWAYRKPPVQGWTLSKMMQHHELTAGQIREIYPKLSLWTNYWFTYRDEDKNGLPGYYHGNDSGWDNATTFDTGFPAEGADLAAFLIIQMDVLTDLAKKLGKDREATLWKKRSDETLQKLIAEFWDGEKFVTKNGRTKEVNKKSISLMSYLPILLGKRLPEEIWTKMIKDLKEPGFLVSKFGPATESPTSTLYDSSPDAYWRGAIWAPSTLIVIEGLKKCGEDDYAKEIAKRFCDLCSKEGFAENFNALTGAPLRDPAYTWTTSVFLVLAHEYLR